MANREAAIGNLREVCRMAKALKKIAWSKDIAEADIKLTGSIRLNGGIDRLAAKLGLPVETEPFMDDEGETLECAFKVIRMGDVEILQVEDAPDAED